MPRGSHPAGGGAARRRIRRPTSARSRRPIDSLAELLDPNAVKVVSDAQGRALYFSRAPIPWNRDGAAGGARQPARLQRGAPPHRPVRLSRRGAAAPRRRCRSGSSRRARSSSSCAPSSTVSAFRWPRPRERPGPDVNTLADLERVAALLGAGCGARAARLRSRRCRGGPVRGDVSRRGPCAHGGAPRSRLELPRARPVKLPAPRGLRSVNVPMRPAFYRPGTAHLPQELFANMNRRQTTVRHGARRPPRRGGAVAECVRDRAAARAAPATAACAAAAAATERGVCLSAARPDPAAAGPGSLRVQHLGHAADRF